MSQIDDLSAQIETYLEPDQVKKVRRAYSFSAKAHEGQHRLSGEPYIQHPLEVARILAGMHMDHQTLVAAILHDVIEDTATAKEQIKREFGKGVAELVDGVSKLKQIEFDSYAEAQAHNFRKMLMAVAHDIRVILVKLADRLHNMRTLGALPPKKRRLIARETLEIYAPIAQRLGMNSIRLELEELGFAALHPMRHRVLSEQVKKARGHRKEIVNKIKNALKRRLQQEKLPAEIIGREKHLYGIYKKMRNKGLSFAEVFDVYAFRIIVDTVDTCYRVLGAVHNLYKPVPGKFKDYIAIPKANGYQSLHTVLFGPYGVSIEVQIRTKEMDDVGEAGIAAHWLYKSGEGEKTTAHKRAREWLRGILEIQQTAGNPEEFLEHVKVDLFPDEVYVFTPKGDIIELPRGATAVDLAYTIHTDVGNTCVGARIDRRLAPLSTSLSTGQSVEIITAPGAKPNPVWLKFVVTAKARSTIRHYLKNLKHDEAIALGKRMLNLELKNFSLSFDDISPRQLSTALKSFNLNDKNELLEDLGLGKRMAPLVARHLAPSHREPWKLPWKRGSASARPLFIKGTEGMVVSFPKCCYPIPGDPILGFASAGRGIVVHHQSCKNVAEYRKEPEKWVNVEWETQVDRDFPAAIRMNVTNQRGVLATVAAAIADEGANIENVEMQDRDDRYIRLSFVIAVRDRNHLARVMHKVRGVKHVSGINRTQK
ncbi:MAG: bifunctional GTP diphosphokinase/guanosine-3',5'-bis pyrophosphate 3'-pyrophosphohydrolase [Gammaproteobacteria bacterium]